MSTVSTTAGGDGLEFDRSIGTIFEQIQAIKRYQESKLEEIETREAKPPQKIIKEDREFSLANVPVDLNPLRVLLEAMESLELIKIDISRSQDTEQELLQMLRALKGKSSFVSTCSETLNMLLFECAQSHE